MCICAYVRVRMWYRSAKAAMHDICDRGSYRVRTGSAAEHGGVAARSATLLLCSATLRTDPLRKVLCWVDMIVEKLLYPALRLKLRFDNAAVETKQIAADYR